MSRPIFRHRPRSRVVTTSFVYFVFVICFSIFPSCTSLSLSHNSFTCVCVCVSCFPTPPSSFPFLYFIYCYQGNLISIFFNVFKEIYSHDHQDSRMHWSQKPSNPLNMGNFKKVEIFGTFLSPPIDGCINCRLHGKDENMVIVLQAVRM